MRARVIAAAAACPPRAERDPGRDCERATDTRRPGSERIVGDVCDGDRDGPADPDPLTATHFSPQNNVRLNAYKYGRVSSSLWVSTSR